MPPGTEPEPLKTLEQKRAARAWKQVEEIVQRKPQNKLGENYRTIVRKAPAMVKMNGLGQMLAFLLAKEEKSAQDVRRKGPSQAEGYLYKHLEEWLLDPDAPVAWSTAQPPGQRQSNQGQREEEHTLIGKLMEVDSVVYRQVTREALAYLGWLKRFAEARLKRGQEGGPS